MHAWTRKSKDDRHLAWAKAAGPIPERAGQRYGASGILDLQRVVGNQAVQRLLQAPQKGDGAWLQTQPEEPGLAPESTIAGTLPDVETAPGEGRETGVEEPAEDLAMPTGAGNVVADIQVSFNQPRSAVSNGKFDKVLSAVLPGSFSQPSGRKVKPFGSEAYEPSFTGVKYTFGSGKCVISANLDLSCPWGTNAGGHTDVTSATDKVVTKKSWPAIKKDLEPSSKSPHKSPRNKYYSQALVEKHEKFHGTDDHQWTVASGLAITKQVLEGANVSKWSANLVVPGLLDNARKKLISENWKYYTGGGSSHSTYAGEIRAYADGRPHYQHLADAVEKHGKTLK